jgi:hypothetical protein
VAKFNATYARRKAQHLCFDCEAPLGASTYRYCEPCLQIGRDRRKRTYQRNIAEGRCAHCSKRRDNDTKFCSACLAYQKLYFQDLKVTALTAYGGPVCVCCTETEVAFLSLDHINGDGNKHRRQLKAQGGHFYLKLRQRGFPTEPPMQVLCMNCQFGRKHNNGVCPHQQVM